MAEKVATFPSKSEAQPPLQPHGPTLSKLLELVREAVEGNQDLAEHLALQRYFAAEVLYYALGGQKSGWVPATVRVRGVNHWFLRRGRAVADPTRGQFASEPDYDAGRDCGFLTAVPSWTARELARRAGLEVE